MTERRMSTTETIHEYLERCGFRCRSDANVVNVSESSGRFLLRFEIDPSAEDLAPNEIEWLFDREGVVGMLHSNGVRGLSLVRVRKNGHPNLEPSFKYLPTDGRYPNEELSEAEARLRHPGNLIVSYSILDEDRERRRAIFVWPNEDAMDQENLIAIYWSKSH